MGEDKSGDHVAWGRREMEHRTTQKRSQELTLVWTNERRDLRMENGIVDWLSRNSSEWKVARGYGQEELAVTDVPQCCTAHGQ